MRNPSLDETKWGGRGDTGIPELKLEVNPGKAQLPKIVQVHAHTPLQPIKSSKGSLRAKTSLNQLVGAWKPPTS